MISAVQKIHQESLPNSLYAKTIRKQHQERKDFDPQEPFFFHAGRKIGHTYAQIANCLSNLIEVDRAHYKKRVGVTRRIMAEQKLRSIQQKLVEESSQWEEELLSQSKTNALDRNSDQFIYDLIEFLASEGVIFLESERVNDRYSSKMNRTSKILIATIIAIYKKTERGIKYLFSQREIDGNYLTLGGKNILGNLIDHALQYGYTYEDLPLLTDLSPEYLEDVFQKLSEVPNTIDRRDLIGIGR